MAEIDIFNTPPSPEQQADEAFAAEMNAKAGLSPSAGPPKVNQATTWQSFLGYGILATAGFLVWKAIRIKRRGRR